MDVGLAGVLAGDEHLQGHHAVEPPVPRAVDDAHRPAGHLGEDLVVAELGAAQAHALGGLGPGARSGGVGAGGLPGGGKSSEKLRSSIYRQSQRKPFAS